MPRKKAKTKKPKINLQNDIVCHIPTVLLCIVFEYAMDLDATLWYLLGELWTDPIIISRFVCEFARECDEEPKNKGLLRYHVRSAFSSDFSKDLEGCLQRRFYFHIAALQQHLHREDLFYDFTQILQRYTNFTLDIMDRRYETTLRLVVNNLPIDIHFIVHTTLQDQHRCTAVTEQDRCETGFACYSGEHEVMLVGPSLLELQLSTAMSSRFQTLLKVCFLRMMRKVMMYILTLRKELGISVSTLVQEFSAMDYCHPDIE